MYVTRSCTTHTIVGVGPAPHYREDIQIYIPRAHNHTMAHCKLGQIVYHVMSLFSSRCTACLVDPYLYVEKMPRAATPGCHCKELTVALLHVRGIQAVLLGSRPQASAARLLPGALPAQKVQSTPPPQQQPPPASPALKGPMLHQQKAVVSVLTKHPSLHSLRATLPRFYPSE